VQMPRVGDKLHEVKQALERQWAAKPTGKSHDELYQDDAQMRAQEYTGYRHGAACASCDVQAICDGLYGDYADLFGDGEVRPIAVGRRVADPQHFSRQQAKKIHPEDMDWLHMP